MSQSIVQANSKSAIRDFLAETIATHPPRVRNALRLKKWRTYEIVPYLQNIFFPIFSGVHMCSLRSRRDGDDTQVHDHDASTINSAHKNSR